MKVFGNSNFRRTVINPAHPMFFFRLHKKTTGLVHATYSFPKWQAVKLTFFAGVDLGGGCRGCGGGGGGLLVLK